MRGKTAASTGSPIAGFLCGDILDWISGVKDRSMSHHRSAPGGDAPEIRGRVRELGSDRMVYVSCNPATLARDLGLMKERYVVMEVQPVDMFPHTPHIEAVARLKRK